MFRGYDLVTLVVVAPLSRSAWPPAGVNGPPLGCCAAHDELKDYDPTIDEAELLTGDW